MEEYTNLLKKLSGNHINTYYPKEKIEWIKYIEEFAKYED